jgi:PKHD-type hydroxylase
MKLSEKRICTTNRICPNISTIFTIPNVFTSEECKRIINTGLDNWQEKPALAGEKLDPDYRNITLFIPVDGDPELSNKLYAEILNMNSLENGYQFHIQGIGESLGLMRYQAENIDKEGKPGHYDWHLDIGPEPIPSMRKISFSILLNPGEYEGGELFFNTGNNTPEETPGQDGIGNMIAFPSYLLHKVSHVTSGTRYTLVGWAHGNSFI